MVFKVPSNTDHCVILLLREVPKCMWPTVNLIGILFTKMVSAVVL